MFLLENFFVSRNLKQIYEKQILEFFDDTNSNH